MLTLQLTVQNKSTLSGRRRKAIDFVESDMMPLDFFAMIVLLPYMEMF